LPKAGQGKATFWLQNPGDVPVDIAEVRTSCDCFRVILLTPVVGPGERVEATAMVDLAHDPEFSGRLGLDATGYTLSKKTIAFLIRADVKVDTEPRVSASSKQ
jgi:hypothetical protein